MRTRLRLFLAILAAVLSVAPDALAVVGRPLTPMSYAGVARRTTRRTAYAYGGAAAVGAAATAAYLTALPAGCAVNVPCAGVTYVPQYHGTTVVYVVK